MTLVAFLSKSLNKIERNYKIHDRKMLVVIRELENWRHLLEDTLSSRSGLITRIWNIL